MTHILKFVGQSKISRQRAWLVVTIVGLGVTMTYLASGQARPSPAGNSAAAGRAATAEDFARLPNVPAGRETTDGLIGSDDSNRE